MFRIIMKCFYFVFCFFSASVHYAVEREVIIWYVDISSKKVSYDGRINGCLCLLAENKKNKERPLLLTEVFPCIVVTEWEIISPKPVSSLQ